MHKKFSLLILILLLNAVSSHVSLASLPNPTERIEYWQENYSVLLADTNNKVKQANLIFNKVLQAAGNRPGVEPRLLIIKENPLNVSLPISIPDGWIILSQKVLDICYSNKKHGSDRLAFVLAHEIAHQLENDFWHMKFFQIMATSTDKNNKITQELRNIAQQSNKIRAKELRADELGIIYSIMAGYNVNTIIEKKKENTFFDEWVAALNPDRVHNNYQNSTHPNSQQRATAVRARLEQVSNKGDLFSIGLMFYQAGDFTRAIQSFNEFKKYYPGREVYINLGASYHQLAMQYYHSQPKEKGDLPLKTSVAIDPLNRASKIATRSVSISNDKFNEALRHAISNYKKAISLDSENIIAYNNIASAYTLLKQPYKAIAHLQDAEKIQADHPIMLNNMGTAFHLANNQPEANKYLTKARNLGIKNNYVTPLYNLGVIAYQNGEKDKAKHYWLEYLSKDKDSAWANLITNTMGLNLTQKPSITKREKLANLEVGTYVEEIPASWHTHTTKTLTLGSSPFKIIRYLNGVTSLIESREVRILKTQANFRGKTARNIRIGNKIDDVIQKYGSPEQTYISSQGKYLAYVSEGISIQITNGKVSGWILFWN